MCRQKATFIGLLIAVCLSITGVGHAATIDATSCSHPDVGAAVNSAQSGDTVVVPAGECSWGSTLNISKDITLQGAGVGNTTINSTGGTLISLGLSNARITGFTFDHTSGGTVILIAPGGESFRIDHNEFTTSIGTKRDVIMIRGTQDDHPYGLIDNNDFYNSRVVVYGDAGYDEYIQWTDDRNFGSAQFIYIEDNTFELDGGAQGNVIDGNAGNKMVMRFNTITNSRIEQHSVQGDLRGTKAFEMYGNTITSGATVAWAGIYPRGGTGFIFNNTLSGSWNSPIYFDNVRSQRDVGGYFGACDGNSAVDGNDNATGWPCRDQIGRGKDLSAWPNSAPYPDQECTPTYMWDNSHTVVVNGSSQDHIQKDRDYYEEVASFDGTSGVGVGTYAQMVAITSCTKGVGFWATDMGEWNSKNPGKDGQLYVCNDSNTWVLYYTPYTYPHPLRNTVLSDSLQAPENLRIVSIE